MLQIGRRDEDKDRTEELCERLQLASQGCGTAKSKVEDAVAVSVEVLAANFFLLRSKVADSNFLK
jgi:hypothetical protein